jgi:hypothetical protein
MTAGITPSLLEEGLPEDLAGTALAMARRFQDGATMWCAAPSWEPHAHHMAVEFVHPVSAGKRALPAFALTGADLTMQARVAVRPGDILIAVAGAAETEVADLMRRAAAWGALSVWIGSGSRPSGDAAEHVLWNEDNDPLAPATGRFVLLYHLLWELTHACLEHPGLLAEPATGVKETGGARSEEGRLGEVITPPAVPFGQALVRTAAGQEDVDVTLISPVLAGDLVLIHAGAALVKVS